MIMVNHGRRLFTMNLFSKTDISTFDKAISGSIVTIVGQKIVVKLPKNMKSNAS